MGQFGKKRLMLGGGVISGLSFCATARRAFIPPATELAVAAALVMRAIPEMLIHISVALDARAAPSARGPRRDPEGLAAPAPEPAPTSIVSIT